MTFDRGFARFFPLLALSALLTTCNRFEPSPEWLAKELLPELVFVGEQPSPAPEGPSHGIEPMQLPSKFRQNRAYIFHNVASIDNIAYGMEVLPTRLRRIQAKLIYYPRGYGDFVIGLWGALFQLVFEIEGQRMALDVRTVHDLPEDDQGEAFVRYDFYLSPFYQRVDSR